jgi:leader peptidase (prepilin peptidase)/N-methyltransferase
MSILSAPPGAAAPPDAASPSSPLAAELLPGLLLALPLAALLAALAPRPAVAALHGLLALVIVPCALIDRRRRIIPNRLTGPGALLALALGLALDPGGEPRRLLWAGMAAGFLLVFALISPAGMGMGDVKLLAVIGLALGPPVFAALMIALLGNVLTAALLAARRGVRAARRTLLPFGPYLAAGAILAALAGLPLAHGPL